MLLPWKKNKSKESVLQVIREIEILQKELSSKGLGKITRSLDRIVDLLDNSSLVLTEEKKDALLSLIRDMKSHSPKDLEFLLEKKCDYLRMIINGDDISPQQKETIRTENELLRMCDEISALDEKICEIDEAMKTALEPTKRDVWETLNKQIRTLQQKRMVKNKSYQTLFDHYSNIQLAEEVQQSKEDAESILQSCSTFDVEAFEANSEHAGIAAEEVSDNSQRVQSAFEKNYGETSDSFEFEKALEEKLLAEANGSEKEKGQTNH